MLDLPPLVAPTPPVIPAQEGVRCGAAIMDVFLPSEGPDAPAVILWHGEAADAASDWGLREDVRSCRPFRGWAGLLTHRGLRVAAVSHRTSAGWTDPEAPAEDFRQVAARLSSDEPLGVLAFSGGIPVAYTLGQSECAVIVTAYGPLDLGAAAYRQHNRGMTEELEATWSPLRRVSAASPPHLHLEPANDWLPNGTARFKARAEEVGASFELAVHPSGIHGSDFLCDDDFTRQMISRACDLFEEVLLNQLRP